MISVVLLALFFVMQLLTLALVVVIALRVSDAIPTQSQQELLTDQTVQSTDPQLTVNNEAEILHHRLRRLLMERGVPADDGLKRK